MTFIVLFTRGTSSSSKIFIYSPYLYSRLASMKLAADPNTMTGTECLLCITGGIYKEHSLSGNSWVSAVIMNFFSSTKIRTAPKIFQVIAQQEASLFMNSHRFRCENVTASSAKITSSKDLFILSHLRLWAFCFDTFDTIRIMHLDAWLMTILLKAHKKHITRQTLLI